MTIQIINIKAHLEALTDVIRTSFSTVAAQLNLTRKNAPTNPAFIEQEDILTSVSEKKIGFYGYFSKNKLVGCYALEDAGDGLFYVERLAVLPEDRHRGVGRQLVLDAFERVRSMGGEKVSIAIIDENKILKLWYQHLGFNETGIKTFPHLPFTVCFMEYDLM